MELSISAAFTLTLIIYELLGPNQSMGFLQELRRRRVYRMVGFYVVGIDVLERAFDLESLSQVEDLRDFPELESLHLLAYAYRQVGRGDEANVLLTRLHEQLSAYIVERKMNFGPLHHLLAQNFGLRGDFDAAADALEAAIEVGWLRYIQVMNDPTWVETIANPRIAASGQ